VASLVLKVKLRRYVVVMATNIGEIVIFEILVGYVRYALRITHCKILRIVDV